ncbi:eotaxin-like [Pimephales promelas]|uniref:eotaxin-like n=1 Tax=Pimephales promelas TaxID=90988 RepID=UPI00195584A6|nr:eotaxin-like [Pimephales promelas]
MKSHMLGFSAVLLLLLLVSSSVQDPVIRLSCLTTTNTRIPMKNLVGYNIQNKPLFPVIAVRFLTIKGFTICSDPSSQWAIKAMKYLDAKKKPQSASSTARHSVTVAPENTQTTNMTRLLAQNYTS